MNASILRLLGAVAIISASLPTSAGANAPAGHYVVTAGNGTGNGTVYDTKTKLTWQQTVPSTTYSWADAKTYCGSAAVSASLGGTGWRLPTYKELVTIVGYLQTTAPLIDPNAFPGTPATLFWSASPLPGSPPSAWLLSFLNGGASNLFITGTSLDVSSLHSVRCVR